MTRTAIGLFCVFLMSGCAVATSPGGLGRSPGESASGYGYVPLDPLPIVDDSDDRCAIDKAKPVQLLRALPDLSIRFAVADFDANGSLNFGPSKITSEGNVYKAVLDYVNVDGVPVSFYIRKLVAIAPSGKVEPHTLEFQLGSGDRVVAYDVRLAKDLEQAAIQGMSVASAQGDIIRMSPISTEEVRKNLGELSWEPVTIPTYVGIGLRLSADIRALKGGITLSGLGAIGAAADANGLSGTLTVQTLGVNGKSIAVALPLPSKLDQTTVESGILAIGSSRAILYTADDDDVVTTTPRVVGIYSPIGSDPALINAIYSELSKYPPPWQRRCQAKAAAS